MNKLVFLPSLLALLLAACASAPAVSSPPVTGTLQPEATFTPSSTPSPIILPTDTPTPTEAPTPTEVVPNFYPGAAPTLEQFPVVDKSDIPAIIDYLRSQPSLLTPDSPAPEMTSMGKDASGQAIDFGVSCNKGGVINCAPAASIQIAEQGIDPHILIWEVRNKDGSRGYLVDYYADSHQAINDRAYGSLLTHLGSTLFMQVQLGFEKNLQPLYPYAISLFQQPGYEEALQQWIDTGIVPEALEHLIVLIQAQ